MDYRQLRRDYFRTGAIVILAAVLFGCSAHPTVADHTLKKGEKYYGYTLSVENVFPVVFYRFGLTDYSDLGLRLGIPIYGSGIDYSRVLYEKGRKRDVVNLGWSVTPNMNFDFTYYKFRHSKKQGNSMYWALRSMYIPKGVIAGSSMRLGVIFGIYRKGKIGIEGGYLHDFSSIPITKLFSATWDETHPDWNPKYAAFPLVSEGGLPTEHSRIAGLSLRLSVALGGSTPAAPEPPPEETKE
ncbi:MAG: hypothetical protein QF613_05325 [Candidatus Marinimicrobia bacterium]|jgi:hypothetical protein|nr:hypothetical protein [Candidatus Neomarinimicrobiota bacterium]MDP6836239.1 hypothetical protein [Candidatus Neomarinimicrobiota bacterium]MDP6965753.1 hypothetical protein [Candidatus Neomarinimicrobiota bacterium]|tara:strand:- start:756 stop:1478 length:723 start_codon:yes stop_codon:yes gene_type:complete